MKLVNKTDSTIKIDPEREFNFQGVVEKGTIEIESVKIVMKEPDEQCVCPPAVREVGIYKEGTFCNTCGGQV